MTNIFNNKYLITLSGVLLFLFLFLFFFRPVETEDIWWHLKIGQWIVQNQQVPHNEVFSYTTKSPACIYPQWLGSSIYYIVYALGGINGLKIFRSLFFIFIFSIIFLRAYKRMPLLWIFALMLVMAYGIESRCLLRPFVFNYLFIPLYLFILFDHHQGKHNKRIFLLPVLSVIWVNIHIGCFVYGTFLLVLFLLWNVYRIKDTRSSCSQEAYIKVRDIFFVLILHLAAFIVNPYGIAGLIYPYEIFFGGSSYALFMRQVVFNIIAELLPPFNLLNVQKGWWIYILLCSVVLLLRKKKTNIGLYIILFICSIALLVYGRRGVGFFVLSCAFIIVELCGAISFKSNISCDKLCVKKERISFVIMTVLLLGSIINTVNQHIVYKDKSIRRIFMEEDENNIREVLVNLKKYNIMGRVLSFDMYGGYLLWNSFPSLRPLVDGRQTNHIIWTSYLLFKMSPDIFYRAIQNKYKFDIVITNPLKGSSRFYKYFQWHPDWQLINMKGACLVFVKKGVFDLPLHMEEFESKLRYVAIDKSEIFEAYNFFPTVNVLNPMKVLFPEPYYIEAVDEAEVLSMMGYKEAALNLLISTSKKTPFLSVRDRMSEYKKVE